MTDTTPDTGRRRFTIDGPAWRTCQAAASSAANGPRRHAAMVALTNTRRDGARVGLDYDSPSPDAATVTVTLGSAETAAWLADALDAHHEPRLADVVRRAVNVAEEPRSSHTWTATAPDGTLHMGLR